jgi:hypothetical protein
MRLRQLFATHPSLNVKVPVIACRINFAVTSGKGCKIFDQKLQV